MKNKKMLIGVIALVLVIALMAGVYLATRPAAQAGGKHFTVVVVHSDGTEKTFAYSTDAELLGQFLYDEGLLIADETNPGMFHTVDGEKADWNVNQSYWSFYEGDAYANQGVETTVIVDGALYKLVYTLG